MINQDNKRGAERKETLGSVRSKARSLCIGRKTGKRPKQCTVCCFGSIITLYTILHYMTLYSKQGMLSMFGDLEENRKEAQATFMNISPTIVCGFLSLFGPQTKISLCDGNLERVREVETSVTG